MTEHNERFLPEQIDEQIEQIEHSTQQEPVSRLVQDLRIVSQSHTEMLDHVWDRLAEHMEQTQIPSTATQLHLEKRIHTMSEQQPLHQSKPRRRFSSWLALVAAIILAILVVGSSVAIFQFAHSQSPHNTLVSSPMKSQTTRKPTITPTPTPTPLPRDLCPPTGGGNSGWATVCNTNQQTTIDQVHDLKDGNVHMYAGYADSNRIILAYTVQLGKADSNQFPMMTPSLTLTAQKGVNISSRGGSSGSSDRTTMQNYELASIPLLSVANNITTLQVHVSISPDMGMAEQTSFDFSLPFHRGRNATLNQTQIVNGQPITLDHVSVSSTETMIYLRAPQLNMSSDSIDGNEADSLTAPAYELSVGNWGSRNKTSMINDTWSENDDKHLPVEGIELEIDYSLLNKPGDWTLLIHYQVIPGATSDVVFHFKV